MKAKSLLVIACIFAVIIFSSFNTSIYKSQEIEEVVATYDGHEDYGYNFIIMNTNDEERTLTFQEVEKEVLDIFNLDSDELLGMKFKVTYSSQVLVTKDADGYENEDEINTIVKLEKV